MAPLPRRLPGRPPGAHLPVDRAHARAPAPGAPGSDPARDVPRAELDRRLARVPALVRLLLQGRLLRRRPLLLRAGGRLRALRDRATARAAPLLPRRPPLRPPPLRRLSVRRDAGHGAAVAGGGHGGLGASPRAPRAGRGLRPAEPVRRVRDARPGGAAGAGEAPEPRAGLRRRREAPPRSRGHGQRELRLRARRGRAGRLRPDGRVGGDARARDRHLPRPHAVPRHRAVSSDGIAGTAAPSRLGPLRHPARRLSAGPDEHRRARARLLARLSRLLPLPLDPQGRLHQAHADGSPATRRLCDRLEEVRARLGPPDPHATRGPGPTPPRDGAEEDRAGRPTPPRPHFPGRRREGCREDGRSRRPTDAAGGRPMDDIPPV